MDAQESVRGVVAYTPRLTYFEDGTPHLYFRIRIAHARHETDGSWTSLKPTFHDLTAIRKTALEAAARVREGDMIIARGRVDIVRVDRNGASIEIERFRATAIGHDIATTRYEVDHATFLSIERVPERGWPREPSRAPDVARAAGARELGR